MRQSRQHSKIRVFMDFWNFATEWKKLTGSWPQDNLDWAAFPEAIIESLDKVGPIRNVKKEFRAFKVYASAKPADYAYSSGAEPSEVAEEKRRQTWLQNELDQITSYTVDITTQSKEPLQCDFCGSDTPHFFEQGVDTKIAIDLVSLASRDLYDIAVLITDDNDLVPSTQCVQQAIDKQVIHLGFRDRDTEVRDEAWGHLFVDDMLSEIVK